MDVKVVIVILIGIGLVWIFTKREHLEARYYACSQVCDIAHPGLMTRCTWHGGVSRPLSHLNKSAQECDLYYSCVKKCREEQRKEIEKERPESELEGNPTFEAGTRYAHLL
jgi:hypothetical protein